MREESAIIKLPEHVKLPDNDSIIPSSENGFVSKQGIRLRRRHSSSDVLSAYYHLYPLRPCWPYHQQCQFYQ